MSVLCNREFLASLPYYTQFRTTSTIENFFSHTLLHYASKRHRFSLDVYMFCKIITRICCKHLRFALYCCRIMFRMRYQLAVLDHNYHSNRPVRLGHDSNPSYYAQRSRRTNEWVAYRSLQAKQYTYIQGNIYIYHI